MPAPIRSISRARSSRWLLPRREAGADACQGRAAVIRRRVAAGVGSRMTDKSWSAPAEPAKPCATPFQGIALVLQGGGALGAYQAGVYEAMAERDIHPTWISGISIGAINSAIIAGNAPGRRVARLRAFWESITEQSAWSAFFDPGFGGEPGRAGVSYLA